MSRRRPRERAMEHTGWGARAPGVAAGEKGHSGGLHGPSCRGLGDDVVTSASWEVSGLWMERPSLRCRGWFAGVGGGCGLRPC